MLTSFTLENFKSFRELATLPLAPLTMLAGANASGKSNLVEALRLLRLIAEGNKLSRIFKVLRHERFPIRGTARDLAFEGQDRFTLSCRTTDGKWSDYSITLRRSSDDTDFHIVHERIAAAGSESGTPLLNGAPAPPNFKLNKFDFSAGGGMFLDIGISVLPGIKTLPRMENDHVTEEIREVSAFYAHCLSDTVFLDMRPHVMRHYSFKSEISLGENGENLSGVLYNLCQHKENRQQLLELISALPEQAIVDIGFIETQRNEAMVALTETFGGREATYDASLLSDGTLRVLAIAAAALSAKEGSLVVIEEIDNGIHPSRAEELLRRLSDIAKERKLRLLLTTHNPALLDALPQEAVPDVVFCFRHPETGASQLTRLSDLTDYSGLVARGGIGTLMTQGVVDRFVKNPRTPDEKRRQALAWLEEVRAETG